MSNSVDLRTVFAFAREFHQKKKDIGLMLYGEVAMKKNFFQKLMIFINIFSHQAQLDFVVIIQKLNLLLFEWEF